MQSLYDSDYKNLKNYNYYPLPPPYTLPGCGDDKGGGGGT